MRIFSGIQPTGRKHLGNYIGAIAQYVSSQERGEGIFCIVDLHALTVAYDPAELRERVYDTTAILLAAGLDPARCILFRQSDVRESSRWAGEPLVVPEVLEDAVGPNSRAHAIHAGAQRPEHRHVDVRVDEKVAVQHRLTPHQCGVGAEVADLAGAARVAQRPVAPVEHLDEERQVVADVRRLGSATRRSWQIASTGQTGSQAPQSMHSPGLM